MHVDKLQSFDILHAFKKVSHSSQSGAQHTRNLSLLSGGGHAIMLGANAENRATVARLPIG